MRLLFSRALALLPLRLSKLIAPFMARASGLQCLQPEIGADQTLWLVMHSDLAGSRRVRVLADHLIALFADHQDRLAMP